MHYSVGMPATINPNAKTRLVQERDGAAPAQQATAVLHAEMLQRQAAVARLLERLRDGPPTATDDELAQTRRDGRP